MGTSAGFEFEATPENARKLKKMIPALDAITNVCGMDVACTPILSDNGDGSYCLSAQTHWSYDGTNGRAFLIEAKKMMRAEEIEIEISDEWDA